jgi:two-component system CheB/CheR fusion protein
MDEFLQSSTPLRRDATNTADTAAPNETGAGTGENAGTGAGVTGMPGTRGAPDFPVVGIAVLSDGADSFFKFLQNVTAGTGMAYVVALPPDAVPDRVDLDAARQASSIPLVEVSAPTPLQPDHVYLLSPSALLEVRGNIISAVALPAVAGQSMPVDLFFRMLANACLDKAIGILLSDNVDDGALGLARLKDQGGYTFAESSRISGDNAPVDILGKSGSVDFFMPAEAMPEKLVELWNNIRSIRLPLADEAPLNSRATRLIAAQESSLQTDEAGLAELALHEIMALLRVQTGNDFRDYKRATVVRRIERRMQVCAVASLPAYRDILKNSPDEAALLQKDMLIGVTQFFRDPEVFVALELDILPTLFAGKDRSRNEDHSVRAWSAACSSGEEAYSLTMLLSEQANMMADPPEVQVFGTDVDENAIRMARSGLYPAGIAGDITPARLREYLNPVQDSFRIRKELRDKVMFATQNLLRDPPFSRLDLISCRNLLIYLNREVHAQILEMFHFALKPNGYLILGNSESADVLPDHFTVVDKRNRIYRANPVARAGRPISMLSGARHIQNYALPALKPPDARKFSFAQVHQRVLAESAPPSVLVNRQSEIVHLSEGTGQFLRYVAGEPSRNLVTLVEPELRLELRTALFQAIHTGKCIETRRLEIRREARVFHVQMSARPFHDADAGTDFVLVLFHRFAESADEQLQTPRSAAQDAILANLEEDLQRTKAQLQETIEHSETSTEELKASNEELQAINEELRSTTEELETSKEELQAVNEELVTVNHELKNKIEETSKTNDDLQNLISSTEIATIFVDRGMRIKRFTPRATTIFNILPGDVGRSLHDITHKLDYEELANDAATTFETLRVVEREVSSSAGHTYIARLLPYRTLHDRIDGAILTFIDITGRRQAEERLRAGEERMRLLAESIKDYAIITTDTAGVITSFNTGAERMFGYTEREVTGMQFDLIFTPEDRAAGVPAEERRRALSDGRCEDERWHIRKDGTRFFSSGVMTPMRDGELYGFARIGRDLTGRLQAENLRLDQLTEEQLKRAEAQAANALKDEFFAVMSHELKHPLNLIHMNAELLMRLPQIRDPAAARAVTTIHSSAVGQARIINDLLDISRLKSGKLALTLTSFDLVAAVKSVVRSVREDPAAARLEIVVEAPEAPLTIHADIDRIEQVVWNLVGNAVKYTPAGGHITVRLESAQSQAWLQVIDDGQGIGAEFLPRVFDMTGRANPALSRHVGASATMPAPPDDDGDAENVPGLQAAVNGGYAGGLGIGMGLVRQIIELHGGRAEVDSAGPGLGSRFQLWLPLQASGESGGRRVQVNTKAAVSGLRILLVDDMQDALDIFKILLEYHGATVESTTSARVAMTLLDTHGFDLIMSDIGMPDMDGYAFIKELRRHPRHEHTPAIAVTGFGRAKDVERALESGYNEHVSKPVAIDAVLRKVSQLGIARQNDPDPD